MTQFSLMTALNPEAPVSDVIPLAKATEAAGFETLWLWDSWASKDVNIGLALAALNTTRLKLATGVSPTPLRHSALLVNSIATVDDISGGRAILGVGSGGQATVGRLGLRKARIAEFRDEMKLIHFLLEGGEVNEDGKRYHIASAKRHIPLYTAAWGPRMLTVSGEHADGVIIMAPEQPAVFGEKMQRIRNAAVGAGRYPADVKLVLQIRPAYAPDPSDLIAQYKSLAVHTMQRIGYEKEYAPEFAPLFKKVREHVREIAMPAGESPGTELIPDEFVRHAFMVGTQAECTERLRDLIALGPDEIVFSISYATVNDVKKFAALVSAATQ
jgi:5,10-methylenetetrahydromethanopterin reductase